MTDKKIEFKIISRAKLLINIKKMSGNMFWLMIIIFFIVYQYRREIASASILDPNNTTNIWKEKYLGHKFSKTDLDDLKKFNIEEIDNYLGRTVYAYAYLGTELVKLGAKIVKENDGFVLELPENLEPRNHIIRLKNAKTIYTIDWMKQHLVTKICLSFGDKKYYFDDLSLVELYFDIQKQINS